jgi:hypothetical protein
MSLVQMANKKVFESETFTEFTQKEFVGFSEVMKKLIRSSTQVKNPTGATESVNSLYRRFIINYCFRTG